MCSGALPLGVQDPADGEEQLPAEPRERRRRGRGRALQVDPVKPMLKPPGTKRLSLKYDILLSSRAFIMYLRRYNEQYYEVGRCRLIVLKPVFKASMASALEARLP